MRKSRDWTVTLQTVTVLNEEQVHDLRQTLRWRDARINYKSTTGELAVSINAHMPDATSAIADLAMAVGSWASLNLIRLLAVEVQVDPGAYVGPHDRGRVSGDRAGAR